MKQLRQINLSVRVISDRLKNYKQMKKYIPVFLASFLLVLTTLAQVPDKPNPPRLVNDYTGLLSPGEKQALENKLDKIGRASCRERV